VQVIDTHCHYNLEPIFSGKKSHFSIKDNHPILKMNWQDHWKNAQEKGVVGAVIAGSDLESCKSGLEVAQQDSKIIAAIGIHPHHALDHSIEEYIKFFEENLPNENIKAIGETGLDYFRLNKNSEEFKKIQQAQHSLFELQIKIALDHDLPLIVHVRDDQENAYWETLEILKKYPKLKFVLHCASGPLKYIKEALDIGAYIGFDGNISYKNTDDLKEILKNTPQDKILIETDSPYLPPQGYRGQVCEPWMVTEVAKYIEENFQVNLDAVLENSKKFFSYQF
jgi:TatD DNase family protein